MTHTNICRLTFAISLLIASFGVSAQSKDYTTITFWQHDSAKIITKSTDSIILKKQPFSITFYSKRYDSKNEKYHALQVAVLKDAADTLKLVVGKSIEDIPYLASGSGMATGASGLYDAMMIDNEGHHYLYYEDEAERRVSRVAIVKELLELEWQISGAFMDNEDVSLSDLKLPALYFVFFADRNLNEAIDQHEIKIVKVRFR